MGKPIVISMTIPLDHEVWEWLKAKTDKERKTPQEFITGILTSAYYNDPGKDSITIST